jgi:hypothetical protein
MIHGRDGHFGRDDGGRSVFAVQRLTDANIGSAEYLSVGRSIHTSIILSIIQTSCERLQMDRSQRHALVF